VGGYDVKGYHLANTLIHAVAALALFGLMRRTLLRPAMREKFGVAALPLAFAVALLWALHPLQTESVTFVIQRSESLMGMFYLLTLYGFIRAVESASPRRWQIFTVIVCFLGMATKEVMVSAPVLVLLYDRTFVAGNFRRAWQQRRTFYLSLAATWVLLAYTVIAAGQRGGAAGFGRGVSSWDYALTQCHAIILYLRLAFWPSPLVVDYGTTIVRRFGEVWWQALLLIGLVAGTCFALVRRPAVGFAGFWFFAILAPSSSVVPLITQTMAEHRMYLSLAAVIGLVVLGGYRWLGRGSLPVWLGLAVVAGIFTVRRNQDYQSNVRLWTVTVAEQPGNPRAQSSLGCALAIEGRNAEAEQHLAEAVRLKPDYAEPQFNWGNFLFRQYRPAEALAPLEAAVRLRPPYFEAHFVLAGVLVQLGRVDEGLAHFETVLKMRPDYVEARQTMAETLAKAGRTGEALENFEMALRLRPNSAMLQSEVGDSLGRLGRVEEAVGYLAAAVRLDPAAVVARYNLGNALFALHRFPEAAEQYAMVVRLHPEFVEAHNNLANTLGQLGRLEEAQAEYEAALRLKPDFAPARNNLNRLLERKAAGSR
ncbi:MAG: tetratricopeptide repeat protein, partial [Opitutaceae bacterium]